MAMTNAERQAKSRLNRALKAEKQEKAKEAAYQAEKAGFLREITTLKAEFAALKQEKQKEELKELQIAFNRGFLESLKSCRSKKEIANGLRYFYMTIAQIEEAAGVYYDFLPYSPKTGFDTSFLDGIYNDDGTFNLQ